jgi:hypothetical protein
VSVYFLKAKQVYTVRKMEKDKWIYYIFVSAGMEFGNKFLRGIPAHVEQCIEANVSGNNYLAGC